MSKPVTRGRNDLWGGLLLAIGVVLAATAFVGVSLFQIGAVAFFVWLALTRKQGWAWIPAAFFGFHLAQDLFDGVGGSLFFPLMVVAAGVLMLSRDRISKNATIGILVMLAVIGIASSNRDNPPPPDLGPDAPVEVDPIDERDQLELPPLRGRELVVLLDDIDLALSRSSDRRATVSSDGVGVAEEDDIVLLDARTAADGIELEVPAEARVRVRSTSGDVEATVKGYALDVDSLSGELDITLDGRHALTAETVTGEIESDGIEDLDPAEESLTTVAAGPRVQLESVSGSISVSQS